ncbi:MAG: hypothetical protein E5X60_37510, partial [Mesorhizobium sp.]
MPESLPADMAVSPANPSGTIVNFEPAQIARQLRAMLPNASTVTLFHRDDAGRCAGEVIKPIADVAAAVREAREKAGDSHVFAALTGVRLAFLDKQRAGDADGRLPPSLAMYGPEDSIQLVYVVEPDDNLLDALADLQKDDTDDAYCEADFPLPYGGYSMHEDDEAAIAAGEDLT